ncbi:MAG TPA: hypothetical protein VKU00_26740, partial [Chthonomonadaceae bacterium]|nr:hypothetical protein [Chthonomonadaceae bacterium]
MNFWRAIEILNKRKWLILLSMVVASALTAGASRLVGSKWVGTVQLMVPQQSILQSEMFVPGQPTPPPSDILKSQLAVYLAVARSQRVVSPVAKKLHFPGISGKNIEITATSTRLAQLAVSDTSRARAMAIANAVADEFVTQYQLVNSESAEQAVNILSEQLKVANDKLVETRKRYDRFRSEKQLIGNVPAALEMAMTRLKESRHMKDEVTQKLVDAQAQMNTMGNIKLPTAPAPTAPPISPVVTQLQKDLADTDKRIADLLLKYTESWPEVKREKAHREELKKRLTEEMAKPYVPPAAQGMREQSPEMLRLQRHNSLQEEIAGYQAEIVALDSAISSTQQEADRLKSLEGQATDYTSAIAEQTELHNGLVARLNHAQMALDAARGQNPVVIMDKVSDFNPPVNTSEGRTVRVTIIGAVCAFLLTAAILMVMESVDRRLKTVTEAEFVLPMRVVAAIPQPMGRVTYEIMGRAAELQPQSLHAESYHFLGMHVLNQNPPVRSLMMLSAKAEQGSTTALTNLGITLAQAGKKVILVDANIRTPELHQVFEMPNTFGFTDLIANPEPANLNRSLHSTSVTNLSVITSGTHPANPWELFRSPQLMELSRQLHERADYVLYDTASALMFTDALNLAPVVDGAFLCVRALQP